MIERDLLGRGICSEEVLRCMATVPREHFVPADLLSRAYADQALAIDCDQTISQPYIVALMTEALQLRPEHHVLEVGTGSGYQTAVLAELAHDVVTIERHADLADGAKRILRELGYNNIEFVVGDGTQGWPPKAPYDRILITAAAASCPPDLLEQLVDGGRLVAPFGTQYEQVLQALTKHGDRLDREALTPCRFVPLIGESERPPEAGS